MPPARAHAPVLLGESANCENRLLSSLPDDLHDQLSPYLKLVHLPPKQVLFRAREPLTSIWFPCSAVISLVSELESGATLEVGLVGRDGLAGTSVLPGLITMPCDGIVRIPGVALQLNAELFRREVKAHDALRSLVERFTAVLLAQSMQISLCNMFHPVEQRCIRWLLCMNDLVPADDIVLTHDVLATMLGVRRSTVTRVLQALDRAALIEERRGRLVVRDRGRLEGACCECYALMRSGQREVLGF